MCPKLFKVFKLVNMYLLDNYDKICNKGRFTSDGPFIQFVSLRIKGRYSVLSCVLIHEIFQHNVC